MTDRLDSPDAGAAAVRGGAQRIVGFAIGVLLSVGSAALLFRHLGVDDGGRYVLVLSVVTIAVGITEAGLSALGVRELAQRDPEEAPLLLRSLLGLRLVLSLAGVAVACAYVALAGYDGELVLGTALAGVAILFQGVQAVLTVVLQAQLRLGAVTVADLVRQVANVLAIVVLVLAGAGLIAFFAALIVAGVCGLVATALMLQGTMPLRPGFDRARWSELLRLTLPFALATAVAVVYLRVGLLLLDALTTERETGLYAVSFRVVEVVTTVPALLVGSAFPIFARAARDDAARLRHAVQRTFDASVLLGVFVAVMLIAGAPVVIDVIGGPGYDAAHGVLRWHALALCGSFAAQPFGFALLATGRTRGILAMTLVALAVSVAVTIPLASASGAHGAAAAAAAAEWSLALTGAILLRRHGGPRLTYRRTIAALAAGALALAPALVLASLPATVAAGLLFTALALAFGLVPDELSGPLRARLRRAQDAASRSR